MPTYEYECEKCDHRFEKSQSIIAAPLSRCPKCRGKLHRVIYGGAGLLFKGSGFYSTDYRGSGGSHNSSPKKKLPCGSDTPCKGGSCPKED